MVDVIGQFGRGLEVGERIANRPQRDELAQLALQSQRQSLGARETQAAQQEQEFGQSQAIQRARILNQSARALKAIDPTTRGAAYERLRPQLEQIGIDTGQFANATFQDSELDEVIASTEGLIRDPSRLTASMRERQALISEIEPFLDEEGNFDEENANARALSAARDLGVIAKIPTPTEKVVIASDEDLANRIAESQAKITEATEFSKKTGAGRATAIDEGFNRIQQIDANVRNIDRAIAAIDAGASTGAIESRYFPSFREATLKLEQIQSELGLDVVGATTFGALSKGELDLALRTALPTNLQPDALRDFLVDKKTAQDKLRAYFAEQIQFLDQGGTVAGFMRAQERAQQSTTEPQQQGRYSVGQIIDVGGQQYRVTGGDLNDPDVELVQ